MLKFNDFNWMYAQADGAKPAEAPAAGNGAAAKDGAAPAAPRPQGDSGLPMIIMMVVIIVIFFYFMRRSQKRQAQEHEKLVQNLQPGQRVMLHSGLYAKVEKVDSDNREVRLLVDDQKNVTLTYNIMAINKVITEEVQPVKKD